MRISLIVAWRTAIRSVGRSLLISLLIALPIMGISAVSIVGLSVDATPVEKANAILGRTEARVMIVSSPDRDLSQVPTIPEMWRTGESGSSEGLKMSIIQVAPAGARVIPVFSSSAAVRTATGVTTMRVTEGKPWDPSLRGHFITVEGRGPQTSNEVMVSPSALARLGISVGGTLQLRSPVEKTMTVVGVLDDRTVASSTNIVFGKTHSLTKGVPAEQRLTQTEFYLPSTVVDWAGVEEMNAYGATVLSRAVLMDPPPSTSGIEPPASTLAQLILACLLLGGFTVFEVVLLAGAAFAVNMRAQQRTLAIVASIGGTRSTLFRMVSASGIVLGGIGGVLGILAGIGGAALVMQLTSDGSATQYYGFHVNWLILGAIVVFASLVGWIAALAPAVTASRIDIVGALRGARRPPKPSRRRPLFGLITIGVGVVITLLAGAGLVYFASLNRTISRDGGASVAILTVAVIVGPIIAQIGIGLCGPLLLRVIAKVLGNGGLGRRLAARDTARNPARSVPAFLTILTTVFVAVFAMSLVGSFSAKDAEVYSFATIKGQLSSSLWYPSSDGQGVVRAEAPAYVAAVTDNMDVSSVRALSAVPDFEGLAYQGEFGAGQSSVKKYPVLTVPATNVCSMEVRSPDYRAFTDSASDRATRDADPRCKSTQYLNSGATYGARLWVGDNEDLAQILGERPSPEATAALAAGSAVAFYPAYVAGSQIEIDWWSEAQLIEGTWEGKITPLSVDRVDAVVEVPKHPIHFGVIIPTATADRLGLDYSPALVLATPKAPPTDAEMDAVREATSSLTADPEGRSLTLENGPTSQTTLVAWILLAVSSIIAIGASAVAIGLARFDGRRDDTVLDSLGAGNVTRRSFAFWQSAILAGLGSVLGAVLALLPTIAMQLPGSGQPFAPPWLQIAGTAIVLPLVIACGSWLLASPARRRNVRDA